MIWEQGVGGSNPPTPTSTAKGYEILLAAPFLCGGGRCTSTPGPGIRGGEHLTEPARRLLDHFYQDESGFSPLRTREPEALLRISEQSYHPFRFMVTTRFGAKLPPVPVHGYHFF